MAETAISGLGALAANPADGDLFEIVDISDTTMATSGTNKYLAASYVSFRTNAETLTNKTLTAPVIGDFTSAGHSHQNTAGGGQLDHGLALTGLTDDDHTQYLLATGTRIGASSQAQTFTNGIISGVASTFNTHNPDLIGDAVAYGYYIHIYMDGVGGGGQNAFFRAGGTAAAPTAVLSGMSLGTFSFRGYTGSAFTGSKALIAVQATEDWSGTANGTKLIFQTTENLTTTLTTRITISNNGNVGFAGQISPTATVHLGASTTARASLCIPHGTAPTSPVNGDVWTTTTAMLLRLNGTTKNIAVGTTGSAFTQTYSTAARTVNAYTTDTEAAYTGQDNLQGGSVYAKYADLEALRVAYTNLEAGFLNLLQVVTALIDDAQAFAISG